jgi:hypothetical protein
MDPHPIKTTRTEDEPLPANFVADNQWFRENRESLLDEYGECMVLIYEGEVIGTGQTYDETVENARQKLPPDTPVITPVMRVLAHRNPFMRARPNPIVETEKSEG